MSCTYSTYIINFCKFLYLLKGFNFSNQTDFLLYTIADQIKYQPLFRKLYDYSKARMAYKYGFLYFLIKLFEIYVYLILRFCLVNAISTYSRCKIHVMWWEIFNLN